MLRLKEGHSRSISRWRWSWGRTAQFGSRQTAHARLAGRAVVLMAVFAFLLGQARAVEQVIEFDSLDRDSKFALAAQGGRGPAEAYDPTVADPVIDEAPGMTPTPALMSDDLALAPQGSEVPLALPAPPAANPASLPPVVLPQSGDRGILLTESQPRTWQVLPDGLIYHSYLAGTKEPRFASAWLYDKNQGAIWDVSLGGRVGLLRYGTEDRVHPEGWQLDMEGAAFPRLNLEECLDVMATDFRFGLPLTYGIGRYQTKMAFYHLSSHLGDELMLKYPDVERINYSRNAFVWGNSYYCTPDLRVYAETAWSFYTSGGAKPWEFQFGIDYSPAKPTGRKPVPFFAINTNLREEVDFGGNLVVQTGYQWRGESNHLFRAGMQYYTGKSDQYEFYRRYEDKVGLALWYDF